MKGLLCLLTLALGSRVAAAADSPVTRVVGLLTDLKARIEKDGESEQATYDKYACWCETTTGKTAATITAVKETLKTTGNTILKLKGSVAMLSSEIKGLSEDIKKNQDQQAEQTSIREKENTAYMAEKVELEAAVGSLEKAMVVLKAATGASFVQTEQWATTVSDVVSKMTKASATMKMNDEQLGMLSKLGKAGYSPQSATITGILSDMYTTFSKNLQTSTEDEAKAHRNFEDLMATFTKQMTTLTESLSKKEQKKGEDEIQLADATQTYADNEEQLKSEITLFDATKSSCTEKTGDWSKRSSARADELKGIAKALEILTSDESKELFGKAIKPGMSKGGAASFIQVDSQSVVGTGAQKAFQILELHARQAHSFRLAALAADIRMQTAGHFDKVIATIDKLIKQLDSEEQEDVKKVDKCRVDYQSLDLKQEDLSWKIENNKAKVQGHKKAMVQKTTAKEVTITDIEGAEKNLGEMKTKRKAENEAYAQAKDDDEKAIKLLKEAKKALAEYYSKALLLQVAQEPDMKLSGKDSAKGQTDGVVAMLDMIIEDLTAELAESKSAEEAAQVDYDGMKKALDDQVAKLTKSKINLEGQIAEEDTAKTAEADLQKENEGSLTTEETTETDLKKTCDDAIKLQPERRTKRKAEAEGLTQAKEFLAGMNSDALLQTHKEQDVMPHFETLSFLQKRN